MESGEWRVESEELRVKSEEWRVKSEEWRVKSEASPFTLVYIGSMGRSYDLETVVDAVKRMDGVELEIAGSGPKEQSLRARAADCPRIRFHGYLADDALQALLARADAGVVPMFPDSCVGIPYKLADYAAAGLRVLNSLPGEAAELVSRFAAGVSYKAGDVDSLVAAVQEIRRPAPGFSPEAFRDAFDAKRIYAGYVAFVEGCGSHACSPA